MSTMSNTKEKDDPCLNHWFHMSKSTKSELNMTNNSVFNRYIILFSYGII
jgi:hypothetical protein